MKKTLAIILTAVMLLGLVPMAAFAKEAHNGPADVEWAFISVFYADEDEPDDEAYGHIYTEKKAFNDVVPGVTYDKATNTLTLDNYKNKKAGISANMMGDDFTIKVVGECEIAQIMAWGDGWGGSVTITGTGTLTVNEDGIAGRAIVFYAEHTESKLTVDKGVTVKLFGEDGVFYSNTNLIDDADKAVTAVSGQELFDIDVAPFIYQNSQYLTVNVITDAETDGYKGNAAVKADDPNTYYGVSIWTNSYGEKEYHVSRYVYSEEYAVYFKDASFDEQYANEYGEVNFTKEEFEELGFSMTVTGKELSSIFFFDANDAHSGPQLINSADPDGIYMLDHNGYSYSDKDDASTYEFKGTIYKLIEGEDGYEADTSFTPIVIGETDYEKLPDGFTAILDEEYEELYLKGAFEEVSGSLYTNGTENQYVIYNLWSSGVDHHYVYAIEEVSDVPGAYVATLVDDIDDVDNSEYTLVTVPEETDMFVFTTETTEFTFTGDGQSTEPAPSFPDVPENAWFYDAATYCAEKGFITGYKNGNFGPADALQRQDFVVILARIAGAELDSYDSCKLTDVDINAYYGKAVAWAVDKGIIGGYDNGKFGVGDKITREQVATILYRYMGSPDVDTSVLDKFPDKGRISAFALNAIAWANTNGVINGKADGTLAPVATASRAEIATIIMRMDQKGMFNT